MPHIRALRGPACLQQLERVLKSEDDQRNAAQETTIFCLVEQSDFLVLGEESRGAADAWRSDQDTGDQSPHQRASVSGQVLRIAQQIGPFTEKVTRALLKITRIAEREGDEDWLLILEETRGPDKQTREFGTSEVPLLIFITYRVITSHIIAE